MSPALAGRFFTTSATGKLDQLYSNIKKNVNKVGSKKKTRGKGRIGFSPLSFLTYRVDILTPTVECGLKKSMQHA